MRRTPVETLEHFVEEKLGRGAAISIDRRPQGFVATAWTPKGVCAASSLVMATKVLAIRDLRRALG